MAEQILPNLYRIEIPLPKNPLKSLNSYVIKGPNRNLIVDTGMNRDECIRPMMAGLAELGVDLNKTDFFITHVHVDHIGMLSTLATDTSVSYFNRQEVGLANSESEDDYWKRFYDFYFSHGFPGEELRRSLDAHPGKRFGLKRRINFSVLKDSDLIKVGDFSFRCVETPGHSPGHMCLYEASKKILIAGDHIIFDITPNISSWLTMPNPLQSYLDSLDKVYNLEVDHLLPGHRSIMTDHKKRIRELHEHHRNRLDEVIVALKDGPKNAFQIAPYITWDIDCDTWAQFPAQQKWFAFGETLAHLFYLEGKRKIKRGMEGDKIVFLLA